MDGPLEGFYCLGTATFPSLTSACSFSFIVPVFSVSNIVTAVKHVRLLEGLDVKCRIPGLLLHEAADEAAVHTCYQL